MPVQDDRRETEIRTLFQLDYVEAEGRSGIDAHLTIDGVTLPFELKSSTSGSVTTVRDFSPAHVAKWELKHWLIGFYDRAGTTLQYCLYGSPAAMAPWINEKLEYIKADLDLANLLPDGLTFDHLWRICGQKDTYSIADAKRLHKKQLTAQQYRNRCDVRQFVGRRETPIGYSPERMLEFLRERARYVILRGSTLNNPHNTAELFPGLAPDH